MDFADYVQKAVAEERASHDEYMTMADLADAEGRSDVASKLRYMAVDESRHRNTLVEIMSEMAAPTMGNGPMFQERELRRGEYASFPSSVADWANLGERIKEKVSFDYELHANVNAHVTNIQLDTPGSEDSKRWLTLKAGELNIQ